MPKSSAKASRKRPAWGGKGLTIAQERAQRRAWEGSLTPEQSEQLDDLANRDLLRLKAKGRKRVPRAGARRSAA